MKEIPFVINMANTEVYIRHRLYSTSMGSMEAAIRQKVFGMNIHHQNPFLY